MLHQTKVQVGLAKEQTETKNAVQGDTTRIKEAEINSQTKII